MKDQSKATRPSLAVRGPAAIVGLAVALSVSIGAVPAAAHTQVSSTALASASAASQIAPSKGAVPASVSEPIARAKQALDRATATIDAHQPGRAVAALTTLRRQVALANAAAIAQIGQPPVDPESDDTPGPPSVLATLRVEHLVSTSVVGFFDGRTNAKLLRAQRQVLHTTYVRRDAMLDAVIALPAEGEGADYADGMADTVAWYANEVTQLTTALDTFELTSVGRHALANSLTRATATKDKVDQAFGGGEKG